MKKERYETVKNLEISDGTVIFEEIKVKTKQIFKITFGKFVKFQSIKPFLNPYWITVRFCS